jgi:AraC family transcriptional regulator
MGDRMGSDERARLERALRYIEEHLAEPLPLAEVARASHLSPFHFHRMFRASVGEPVGRYITRRRLERAALRLAYEPDAPVTEIALEVGYSSISNFSKAFRLQFGCAPSALRSARPGPALPSRARRPLDPARLHPADETDRRLAELAAAVRFERREEMALACLASPEGYDLASLTATWAELIARGQALGLCGEAVDAWGLAHDSPRLTAPELCRYHAAIPCPSSTPLPSPLFRGQIPAGRYAVFPYAGPVDRLEEHYLAIYSLWLPISGVSPDDFVALDRYVGDWPQDGRVDMEIWIKIR